MEFQIEAIMAESREYTRRRNLLAPEDQVRADYLLKRINSVRGGIFYALLAGIYYTIAFFVFFCVLVALAEILRGEGNQITLIMIGVGIFVALIGPAFYFLRYKPRHLEFQRELEADFRLARVFKAMGFRSP